MTKPILVVIVGPTAVGKTSISIELAKKFNSIILSADSRQFYKEINIGTAKPDQKQLSEVPHYFVDNLSIHDFYSVGAFEQDVLAFLAKHFEQNRVAFLVGGSGLYIDAVLNGLDDLPQVPEELRWQIMQEIDSQGLSILLEELKAKDPVYFNAVDRSNTQRVARAIEVMRYTGLPFSSFFKKSTRTLPFEIVKIGITAERASLYENINKRVDEMMTQGQLEEARQMHEFKELYALQTVGYKELFDYFEGKCSLDEAIELVKRNTRRFAKRQLTWFRRDTSTVWFQNNQTEAIAQLLSEKLK